MAIKERLGERLPYAEIPRGFGQGALRLGTNLQISGGSIYYLSFVSWVKDDIMDKYFDLNTGKLKEDQPEADPAREAQYNNNTIQDEIIEQSASVNEQATELTLAEQ